MVTRGTKRGSVGTCWQWALDAAKIRETTIVTDPATARPAGRLFRRDGVLTGPVRMRLAPTRPGCRAEPVDVPSPEDYRETAVARIEPDRMPGIDATHTYTFD